MSDTPNRETAVPEVDEAAWRRAGIEPEWWAPLRETHRSMSDVDWEFRARALADPRFLRRASFPAFDRPNDLIIFPLQSWPAFATRERMREFARLSERMHRLMLKVPLLFHERDPRRISEFYRFLDPVRLQVLLAEPNGLATMISRGDFIDTADGFRCIEFNFTPNLGGWDMALLPGLHLESEPTREFLEARGIEPTYTDTIARLFSWIADRVTERKDWEGREVNVVFLFDPRAHQGAVHAPPDPGYFERAHDAACRRRGVGGIVTLARPHHLEIEGTRVFCRGRRVHALVDMTPRPTDTTLYRCFKMGGLLLLNDPIDLVFGDKQNLALLSENAESPLLSSEERELARRHVPWTRCLADREVVYQGRRVRLLDLVLGEQDRMVVKRGMDFGGKGVHLGRATSETEWRRAVDAALDEGTWVVQEVLESRPYLFQERPEGCSPHDVIWGPFVFGGEYAGLILRVQPKSADGAVNLSLAATEGIVFEV